MFGRQCNWEWKWEHFSVYACMCAIVCCTPALSATASVHLVRRHPRLASLQLRRQDCDHHLADWPSAGDGRYLPADAAKSPRSTRSHTVHEVHVPQRVLRGLLVPADTRLDKRRQFRWRPSDPPTATRTAAHYTGMAHRPLCHGSVYTSLQSTVNTLCLKSKFTLFIFVIIFPTVNLFK